MIRSDCSLLPQRGLPVAESTKTNPAILTWLKFAKNLAAATDANASSGRVRAVRPLRKNSRDQRHAHEIGQARRVHFGHESRTIVLDGSRTDPEIVGNLLVGVPRHEPLQ